MNSIFVILLAVVGGIAVTVQGQFMGSMTQILGTRESMFITYASGGIVVTLLLLASGPNHLASWRQVPWFAFTAGLLGLVIVGTVGYVVPRLGLAAGFTIIVTAQFAAAALIDHFGWFGAAVRPVDLPRLVGLGFLLVGVWLLNRQ
jgi:bacterial/archaeal transporter family-2 protein